MFAKRLRDAALASQTREAYRPRPSSVGPDECLRKLVYHASGTPPGIPRRGSPFTLEDGHHHEEATLARLVRLGITIVARHLELDCGSVIRNGQEIPVVGHLDFLGFCPDRVLRVIEHKAPGSRRSRTYQAGHHPLNNFTQVVCYLVGLNREGYAVTEAVLLLRDRNVTQDLAYFDYHLVYDQAKDRLTVVTLELDSGEQVRLNESFEGLYAGALRQLQAVEDAIAADELPDPSYPHPEWAWQCLYCPFWETCWDGWHPKPGQSPLALTAADAAMVAEYAELTERLREPTKRKKALSEKLKLLLKAHGAEQALTDRYRIQLERRFYDEVDLANVPADLRPTLVRQAPREFLHVDPRRWPPQPARTPGNA